MKVLDRHPQILGLVRSLGLASSREATRAIVAFCRDRVANWARESGPVNSIRQLEALACARLNLVFEEFRSEADLRGIVDKYVALGDVVFASLPALFDPDTFATLICRREAGAGRARRYVAVIDCRGRKACRSFFSRWHEIAHLLTLGGRGMDQPLHRSTCKLSPVERLMDMIAGEIAFSDFLFLPVLRTELGGLRTLTFEGAERVRQRFEPEASFQATLIACLKRLEVPALYLEAGLGLTRAEEEQFDREPVPARRPAPKLRILKAVQNEPARSRSFYVPPNLQVPDSSILSGVFFGAQALGQGGELAVTEALEDWKHSNGKALGTGRITVRARANEEQVLALLFPASR